MPKQPKILLIYTGGTIGMIRDFETSALKSFNFDELMSHIPEIKLLECEIETLSFETPIDSSNMHPKYWEQIARIIDDNYQKNDGFVVLHGSDTMSYTASAISFMLENLDKPVIFTGSQLPIGDLRTDAKENLITSIQIAVLQEQGVPVIKEVGLYFEYKLYRANRTTKINADHFQAFASLNYPPLLESGVHLTVNSEKLLHTNSGKKLQVHYALDTRVMLIKLFPGISEAILHCMLGYPDLKGIVLETYGSGNACNEDWFVDCIEQLVFRDIVVVNVTQCSGGSVMMGHYETSVRLRDIGVVSGKDITTEAAMAKLMYLLGQKVPSHAVKTIFETSLRGEMS